jgi:hypothetical protein
MCLSFADEDAASRARIVAAFAQLERAIEDDEAETEAVTGIMCLQQEIG